MSKTSRRALLSALPAVAVAGIPAAASGDDMELLAIGRELAPLVAEWRKAKAADAAENAGFEHRVEARIGPKDESEEYWQKRWAFLEENYDDVASDHNGLDIDDDGYNGHRGWDAINGELSVLNTRAMALRATTREAFAVQVLAWIADYCEVVEDHTEFFTAVCAYAGVSTEWLETP